jgi:glutamyl-tRNA reductase
VNKFLHPPMQALKQAAREGDQTRIDAVCDAWQVSVANHQEPEPHEVEPQIAAVVDAAEAVRR